MRRGELGESLDLVVDLIPEGRTNRPGTPIKVHKITIHNTSNTSAGADALAHARFVSKTGYYMIKDKDGNPKKNWVSWHYTVDDKRVVKHLPTNEKGWHAGPGNQESIGIEICMNSGIDQAAAFDRAARLVAALLHDLGLSLTDVVTHRFWTGKKCPQLLLDGGDEGIKWREFLTDVKSYYDSIKENFSSDIASGINEDDLEDVNLG